MTGGPGVSCRVLAISAQGQQIRTVEGLAQSEKTPDPLQEAFIASDALQCGDCTPGMRMSCRALLNKNSRPHLREIQGALSGNLCRCGTYPHVFKNRVTSGQGQEDLGLFDRFDIGGKGHLVGKAVAYT